ncbi:hypothetical protein KJ632_02680 [Patescibacteria group bacterium]|nr:hypothetical protein [Patescibacteria group bacterium]
MSDSSAPKSSTEKSPEISSNYFERLNLEFAEAMKNGEVLENANIIKDIEKRNERSFFSKVVDAISKPGEVIKYLKNKVIMAMAGSWLGEIFGLGKKLKEAKEKVMDLVGNPVKMIKDMLKKPESLAGLGLGGGVGTLKILLNYFKDNPDKAKDMPGDKSKLGEWWEMIMEKAGVEKKDAEKIAGVLTGKEKLKDGVEYESVGEAFKNFGDEIKLTTMPLLNKINSHPELFGAIATVSILKFRAIRSLALKGFSMGYDSVASLAKLPFKHPIVTATFATAAILYYKGKETMIPKDSENLTKYVLAQKDELANNLDGIDLSGVSGERLKEAIAILKGEVNLGKYFESGEALMGDLALGSVEAVSSNNDKLVQSADISGIKYFGNQMKALAIMEKQSGKLRENLVLEKLSEKSDELLNSYKNGEIFDIERVKTYFEPFANRAGVEFSFEDGLILWQMNDGEKELPYAIKGPTPLMIDGQIDKSYKYEKARSFSVDDSAWEGLLKAGSLTIYDLREIFGEVMMKDVETVEEATRNIEKEFRDGGMMVVMGGYVWLMKAGEGFAHRYLLGPVRLVEHGLKAIGSGLGLADFSYAEAAVDYAGGIVPVMVFGLSKNMVKMDFKNILSFKFLYKTAAYPVTGAIDTFKFTFYHIVPHIQEGTYAAILKDPKLEILSNLQGWKYRARKGFRKISVMPGMKTTGWEGKTLLGAEGQLAKFYKAKELFHEAQYKPLLKEGIYKDINVVLAGTKIEHDVLTESEASEKSFLKVLHGAIDNYEQLIARMDFHNDLIKAKKLLAEGKHTEAKRLLEQYGYKGNLNSMNIEMAIKRNQADVDTLGLGKTLPKRTASTKGPEYSPKVAKNAGRLKSGFKRVGHGVAGAVLGLGVVLGLGKAVEYLRDEDEYFDIESLGNTQNDSKEKLKKNRELTNEAVKNVYMELQDSMARYQDFYEKLVPQKLNSIKEEELEKTVEESGKTHENINLEIKSYLTKNRDALVTYFEQNPEKIESKKFGEYYSIGYDPDKKRPFLKYADKGDFTRALYETFDMYKDNQDKVDENGRLELGAWDHIKGGAVYAIPLYGTYLDARNTIRSLKRGQWKQAAENGFWTTVGAVSDLILIIPGVGWAAGGAVKGLRAGAVGARVATKLAKAAKVGADVMEAVKIQGKVGKVTATAMGVSMGRSLMTPTLGEKYYF